MIESKVNGIPNSQAPPDSAEEIAQAAQPNTGQGGETDARAVGAGHGNQPLDNQSLPDNATPNNDSGRMKPGAQPDGELSGVSSNQRNEDVERAGTT